MASCPALRHKDFGIWQTWTWARLRDEVRAVRHRPAQARPRARRRGGHHRRQPAAPLCDLRGRAEPRRHRRAGLPGLGGRRDGLRARARRGEVRHRPEPGAGRQGHLGRRPAAEAQAASSTTSSAGSPRYDPASLHSFEHVQKLGREELRRNAGRRRLVARRDRQGQGRRRQRHALHVGHHRPAQGRDADARQHRRLRPERQQVRPLHDRGHAAGLPADGLGGRSHLLLRPGLCGRHVRGLPGEPRDHHRGPPRDRARPISSRRRACSRTCSPRSWCAWRTPAASRRDVRLLPAAWRAAAASRSSTASRSAFKDRLLYRLGDLLVYAPLRNRMGFSRIRVAYTAGEAIGPELFRFYRSLGINLKQLYGMTEASVYITLQPDGEVYPDTVGKPGPDVEIKIADSGEVLFKSPGVFLKYYKNDEATARDQDAGRLGAHGRCRLLRPARAPEDHRSRQGRRPAQQRRAVRAEVPREPHQVLSRDARGGGLRPGPRLRDDVHQHRPDLGRQLGRAQQRVVTPATRSWPRIRRSTRWWPSASTS